MDKHCNHNIPETKKGSGPCDIRWEVKKRNGKPNWWCRTHGLDAAAPDGAALPSCSGSWFTAVTEEMQTDIDLSAGEVAVWGVVPPAITIGKVPKELGKVHVHHRTDAAAKKDLDRSYDIVRVHRGEATEVLEGMAAQAFAISELTAMQVLPLACSHCGEVHIDELMFAARPHIKHQCNACGRNFWDTTPSISNPLGGAQARLGLAEPAAPEQVHRPLEISSTNYTGVALWPSNSAIISTMSRAEDKGIHVHAWDETGEPVLDDTYSPVTLEGEVIDEGLLRMLAVQRTLAQHDNAQIVSLTCTECGHSILSPTAGWLQPSTRHMCDACGTENRTRRKSYVNPLSGKPI